MKKTFIKWFIALVVLILLFVLLMLMVTMNRRGYNETAADAKKRGVWVRTYRYHPGEYKINDSTSLQLAEVWIEHRWYEKGLFSQETTIWKDNELRLQVRNDCLKKYADTWFLGTSIWVRGGRRAERAIEVDLDPGYAPDVIKLPLKTLRPGTPVDTGGTTIDTITLIAE